MVVHRKTLVLIVGITKRIRGQRFGKTIYRDCYGRMPLSRLESLRNRSNRNIWKNIVSSLTDVKLYPILVR